MPGFWSASRSSPSIPTSFGAASESILETRTVDPEALPETEDENYLLTLAGRVTGWTAGTSYIRIRLGGSYTAADGSELLSFANSGNGTFSVSVSVPVETFAENAPLKITGDQQGGGDQPQLAEFILMITGAEPEPPPGPDPPTPLVPPAEPRALRGGAAQLGTDVAVLLDADAHWSLATGRRNLALALARRLSTPRGGLFYDPMYGFDIRAYLHMGVTEPELAMLGSQIEDECEKDDRVASATAKVTLSEGNRLEVALGILTAEGPFRLVLGVSELTVDILGRRDNEL